MIEISDRAFGGISTEAKLRWTTEKFREALLEISDMTDAERGYTSRSESIRSSQSGSNCTAVDTPTSSISFSEMKFQHEAVVRAGLAKGKKQEGNNKIGVTEEERWQRKPPLSTPSGRK